MTSTPRDAVLFLLLISFASLCAGQFLWVEWDAVPRSGEGRGGEKRWGREGDRRTETQTETVSEIAWGQLQETETEDKKGKRSCERSGASISQRALLC